MTQSQDPASNLASQDQERSSLEAAVAALEAQRDALGSAVVDVALRPLRQRLLELGGQVLKQVTVLFLDVVGSTTLIQHLDPEDTAEVMDDALMRFTAVVQHHGGRVFNYAGDSVMAAFGTEGVREDDAARAVRCGLDLLAEGRAVAERVRQRHERAEFGVRVGLHTGEVLLGGASDVGSGIRGVMVHIAARMEQAAPPGCLRISRDTHDLVRGLFEAEEQPSLTVKGIDAPLVTYLVHKAAPRTFHLPARGLAGRYAPMIGRDEEFNLLRQAFDILQARRGFTAVTVVAEAGVGKSRLLREFETWLGKRPGFRAFRGRCTPQTQGQPFSLVRDILAWHAEWSDAEPAETSRRKLSDALGAVMAGGDASAAADVLGHLVGLECPQSPHVQGLLASPRKLRGRGFRAASELLRGAGNRPDPALLLIEDLHWADDGSLDFLEFLADVSPPPALLVLAFTRPALFERRRYGSFSSGPHTRLDLEPLEPGASRELAQALLGNLPHIPPALADLVISGAQGNPFYMEELVNMLLDQGCLLPGETDDAPWSLDASRLAATRIPATLTGVLQARIDHLSSAERLALQEASVVGVIFDVPALTALDTAAEAALPTLEARDLAIPRPVYRPQDPREYNFKHWVLQQVTYETVLKRTRRELHGRLADWLAAQTGSRSSEILGSIAEHYDRAERLHEAAEFHLRAATYATSRFAHADALRHTERGLALAENFPPSRANWELRWRLLEQRERSLVFHADRTAGRACLAAAHAAAEALDNDVFRARVAVRRARMALAMGDLATQEAEAEKAIAPATASGSHLDRLRAMRLMGDARSRRRLDRPEPLLLEARAEAERMGYRDIALECVNSLAVQAEIRDRRREALELHIEHLEGIRAGIDKTDLGLALGNAGVGWLNLGVLEKARPLLEEALHHNRLIGDKRSESVTLLNLSQLELWEGRYQAAIAQASQAVALAAAIEAPENEVCALVYLGDAEQAAGQLPAAQAAHQSALDRARGWDPDAPAWSARAGLARVALALGDSAEAKAQIEPLATMLLAGGKPPGLDDPRWIELSCYWALNVAGDPRAVQVLEIAHRNVQAEAALLDEETRRAFLHRIPFNRDILRAWETSGSVRGLEQ